MKSIKLTTIAILSFSTLHTLADTSEKTDLLAKGLDTWKFITKDGEQDTASNWKLENGTLSTSGSTIGYLRTKETFQNYTLTFEWRWQPDTEKNNSGVLVHVSTPAASGPWPKSFEGQLEHGNAGDFWCIGETLKASGQTPNQGKRWLRIADPKEKPLGEWNSMTITCTDSIITIHVNGILTNQGENLSASQGAIAFQSEGFPIEFRNVHLTK